MDATQIFQIVAMFFTAMGFCSCIAGAPHFYLDSAWVYWGHVSLAGLNLFLLALNTAFLAVSLVGG